METGKGTLPKVMKFQLRPDPLANDSDDHDTPRH
jgi:hypothetical protein